MSILGGIPFGIREIVQIAAISVVFYYIFLFFRGTRGAQILVGLGLTLIVMMFLTHILQLDELNYLARRFPLYIALAILVVFQPEIRRALAEVGRQPVLVSQANRRGTVDHVVQAVTHLAEHRVGALIAVARDIGTRAIQETGTRLDAAVTPELLASMFFPHTPLHDGGVIIRDDRIVAAGCVFPLSARTDLQKTLGTRHRAAVGISEETDAVVVVVSEETGAVSVCYRGRLSRGVDSDRLKRFLSALLLKKGRRAHSAWKRVQEQLDLTPEGIAKSENRATEEGAGE